MHKTDPAQDLGLHKMADSLAAVEAQRRRRSGVTFRQQMVLCGKARCRKWHGPYWYAAWKVGRKTRTAYVGSSARLEALLSLLPQRGFTRVPTLIDVPTKRRPTRRTSS